ncbi:MAG TPA: sulfatase-like hydrolase/transferase [Candidatus Merdenecus merdavium]|nr:sulfatase-like hydrolase/transferase [Candidatus Merdenecus merdavium]
MEGRISVGKRPNIIILNPDQMRADSMGHMGNLASITPNLDKLAKEGISFSNAFCQNPVCTPSRCSFMSGWYPHVAGHRTMTHMMQSHEPVLLKYLKDNGYQVWMNQRNDLLPAQHGDYYKDYCTSFFRIDQDHLPESLPDDNWRGEEDGDNYYSFYRGLIPKRKDLDKIWTDGAVNFIENYKEDQPFCIFLPWMNPHPEYQVEEPYFSMIDRKKLPKRIKPKENHKGKPRIIRELAKLQGLQNWNEDRFNELRAVYLGMCSKVDHMTGMIMEVLKKRGIYDNTAIFFFSDHGDYTGDYGLVEKTQNCFEDCLVNVPFLVKLPKEHQNRTGISEDLVELIDFYATAEELAGLPKTHTHFGESLVSYIKGERKKLRDQVFCEGGFRKGEEHCKETGGQKVPSPKGLYYPRQYLQASDEMYNGKAIMCRTKKYKYIRRLYEEDELYDLVKDPKELQNEIDNPEYKEVLMGMKEDLLTHYQDTCDVVPIKKDQRMEKEFKKILMGK